MNLCFLRGAELSDPERVLVGDGKIARHVVLGSPGALDAPEIDDLIGQAVRQMTAWDRERARSVVIRSVSPNRRPRRPAGDR